MGGAQAAGVLATVKQDDMVIPWYGLCPCYGWWKKIRRENHLEDVQNLVNNRINYQSQLVSRIVSSMSLLWEKSTILHSSWCLFLFFS